MDILAKLIRMTKTYQNDVNELQKEIKQLKAEKNSLAEKLTENKEELNQVKSNLEVYQTAYGAVDKIDPDSVLEVGAWDPDRTFIERLEEINGNPFNQEQLQAVRYDMTKNLQIIAGAGSGKTATICAKAAYLSEVEDVSEEKIAMMTFTNKAGQEMEDRIEKYLGRDSKMMIGTFHKVFKDFYLDLLEKVPAVSNYGIQGNYYNINEDEYKNLLSNYIKRYGLQELDKYGDKTLAERIYFWQNTGCDEEEIIYHINNQFSEVYEENEELDFDIGDRFRRMFADFQRKREEKRIINFNDLMLNLFKALDNEPEARKQLRKDYDYIFIDEFQDINQLQVDIVELISPPYTKEAPQLIIVGDDDQSIYQFRGSSPNFIRDFSSHYQVKEIKLMINYRSKAAEIIQAANRLISNNHHVRLAKEMVPAPFATENEHNVEQINLDNTNHEAEWIADKLEAADNLTDYAVLYRQQKQIKTLMTELLHRDIPYVIDIDKIDNGAFDIDTFNYTFELWQQLVAQDEEFEQILKRIIIDLGNKYFIKSVQVKKFIKQKVNTKFNSWQQNLQQISKLFYDHFQRKLEQSGKEDNSKENVLTYFELMQKMAVNKKIDLTQLRNCILAFPVLRKKLSARENYKLQSLFRNNDSLQELIDVKEKIDERIAKMKEKLKDYKAGKYEAVYLLTIHKSKGLAFKNVFLLGCYEGGLPTRDCVRVQNLDLDYEFAKANSPATVEEERRLMYVAVTRAQKNLYLTYPAYQGEELKKASRYLKDIKLPIKDKTTSSDEK